MTYPNIALIGPMGSGKSTIATALEQYGYRRFGWADNVRKVGALAYGNLEKTQLYEVRVNGQHGARTGRDILQRIGTDALRDQVDEDFWIRAGLRLLDSHPGPWVNDDTRFPNEAEALAARGWVVVRIQTPDDLRHARLTELYGDEWRDRVNHPSETSIDQIPVHFQLWNTATPGEVASTLLTTLAQVHAAGGGFRS